MVEQCIVILFPHKIGATAYYSTYFDSGSKPYHLDYVSCSGNESSLLSRNRGYRAVGAHNCRPGFEAGVKCSKFMLCTWIENATWSSLVSRLPTYLPSVCADSST